MIDIVIKSWNTLEYTKLAIDSIRKTTKLPHRIIIVDDGSNEETLNGLRKIEDILLIEHGRNLYPPEVAITALKHIKSQIAVLMDNDIVLQDGWLERLLPYFEDDKVALVAPLKTHSRYIYPGTNKSTKEVWEDIKKLRLPPEEALRKFTQNRNLDDFRKLVVENNNIIDETIMAPPGFVSMCFIVFRVDSVSKAGGLARNIFPTYGGDDVDLCWRLGVANYKIIKSSKVYAHHFEHTSITSNNVDYTARLAENNMVLYGLWGEIVLGKKEELEKQYGVEEMKERFPFIEIFKNIKKHNKSQAF